MKLSTVTLYGDVICLTHQLLQVLISFNKVKLTEWLPAHGLKVGDT